MICREKRDLFAQKKYLYRRISKRPYFEVPTLYQGETESMLLRISHIKIGLLILAFTFGFILFQGCGSSDGTSIPKGSISLKGAME